MYKKYLSKFSAWLLNALKLQLFLNIISLVILAHWGLPTSILSPVGNIIFAPFLAIFLILSSFVFFSELLMISNSWLIYIFEAFTKFWTKLLSLSSESWKLYFIKPSFFISVLLIVLSIIAFKYKKISPLTRIVCLISLFIFFGLYSKFTPKNQFEVLYYRNKKMYVIYKKDKLILHDKGLLEKANWQWIYFELISFLIKKYGHCNVEKLIVEKITKENQNSVKLLTKKCNIQNVQEKQSSKT